MAAINLRLPEDVERLVEDYRRKHGIDTHVAVLRLLEDALHQADCDSLRRRSSARIYRKRPAADAAP